MSLSAIQDNMIKTHMVQQTQARGEEVGRTQDAASVLRQHENSRQADEAVLMTRETEQSAIRPDREKEREGKNKRRNDDEEDGENEDGEEKEAAPRHNTSIRSRSEMHTINILA